MTPARLQYKKYYFTCPLLFPGSSTDHGMKLGLNANLATAQGPSYDHAIDPGINGEQQRLLGGTGWQLAVKTSKGDGTLGTALSPAGHALKERIAALMRVGNVETLAGQKHLHFHTLVQLHQFVGSLHVLHGLSNLT